MKITREFKIGLLTVAATFLFIWGLNFLKGKDIFSRQITFYAVYDDVTGLIESNPVSLSGVNIGQVNRIRFIPDGSGRIVVENIVNRDVVIPDNSVSILTGMSLTGTREIIIQLGDSERLIADGDTLPSGYQASLQDEVSQLVAPIKQRAEDLFIQVDSVLAVFQAIFTEQTRRNITESFESIQSTLYNLEQTTFTLDKTIEAETTRLAAILVNTESITTNLKNNNELISNIIQNFSSISDSIAAANLQQTLLHTEQSLANLNQIMDKVNKGEGSLGLLINDEELYINLTNSSKELEFLLEDIRKNPGSYINISVFGGRR
ncbi:MAG: MCE family protein [Bacteroidetes bacterium]|nr:MAG: MCE family protein [Bacteroidota bacterium]